MNMDEATAVPYAARHADNFQMVWRSLFYA
jgi:hypothetical protein